MILMIDNYDSFTYNLFQYIGKFNQDIQVYRNDKITLGEIEKLAPSHIIISPGPKYPKDAGISIDTIKYFSGKIPILGVCLGHQSIGEAYGSKVIKARNILHGKQSDIRVNNDSLLFKGLPETITAGRYHSLIVEKETLTKQLEVIAEDENGEIMGLMHKSYPVFGVQFHPESILTEAGEAIIKNFLEVAV